MPHLRTITTHVKGFAWRRTLYRIGPVLLVAACLGAAAAEVASAPVGYVYYFRTFGQWTVICGRDDAGGHDNCTLSAPPPEIHGAESQIEIGHGPGERAAVAVRVRGTLMPGSPFYLRVDAGPPHQTIPNRFGEGSWSGAEAQTIIDELNAGQQVVVRWFVGPPPSPRDEVVSLDGFKEAIADFGEKIGSGPLGQSMPPPGPAATREPASGNVPAAAAPDAAAAAGRAAPDAAEDSAQDLRVKAADSAGAASTSAQEQPSGSGDTISILSPYIGRAILTSNVVNREPVDTLTSPVAVTASGPDALFFFTEVVDLAGRAVTHRWEYGGSVVASVSFQIGGERWRVYSRKSVSPGQTGTWTVSASAPDGTVLARATFVVE